MEITLLAFVVVGGFVRISGLVCLHRRDLRVARAPELVMSPVAGPRLTPVGTYVLPNGDLTWMSWDFERLSAVLVAYRGQVDRLDLAYRAGGRIELAAHGPWMFDFQVPCRRSGLRRSQRSGTQSSRPDA